MRIYGYARVSNAEQAEGHSLENQIARLKAAGCDRVLVDVESVFQRSLPYLGKNLDQSC